MNFTKYQGAGNDFILLEDEDCSVLKVIRGKVKALCDRHFGIGADGVIVLQKSSTCDVRMRIFNADGSEADMCGNALRCIVLHLNKEKILIETNAGICLGKLSEKKIYVTFPYAREIKKQVLLSSDREGYLVDTGVPHLIVFEENLETPLFEMEAKKLAHDKRFGAEGVNVSYIKRNKEKVFIRTYERGVEKETLACGSASAAAVFIVRKHDKKERSEYTVYPASKNALHFNFDSKDRIWMEGPARLVFTGNIEITQKQVDENIKA